MTEKKYILPTIITSVLLTGCIENNYEEQDKSNILNSNVPLYHNEPKDNPNPFSLYAVMSDSTQVAVDGNTLGEQSNVDVTFVDENGDMSLAAPLAVSVKQPTIATYNDATSIGSVVFQASRTYDITKTNSSGADPVNGAIGGLMYVDIKLKPDTYDLGTSVERNKVYLTMKSGETVHKEDVTSAFVASSAMYDSQIAQTISVPINCFMEAGIDLTSVDVAMGLEFEGAAEFEMGQAILKGSQEKRDPGKQHYQGCRNNTNSLILNYSDANDEVVLMSQVQTVADKPDWTIDPVKGHFTSMSNTSSDLSSWAGLGKEDYSKIRFHGLNYKKEIDKESSLVMALSGDLKTMELSRLDMSQLINKKLSAKLLINKMPVGLSSAEYLELAFKFNSPSNGTEGAPNGGYGETRKLTVRLYDGAVPTGIENGFDISAATGSVHHDLELTLADFFKRDNGQLMLNTMQFVEKFVVTPALVLESGEKDYLGLKDLQFGIGEIKITNARQ